MRLFRTAIAALCAAAFTTAASAQSDWPTSSDRITIVVPFETGGSTDTLARSIATHLSQHLNDAPVTVVNRPGASGAVGSAWFLRQPDDGSHLLLTHIVPYLANNVLTSGVPMKWEDFAPINVQWQQDSLLFTSKGSGITTTRDLIEAIRDKPGEISASILQGSGAYLELQLMLDELDIPRDNVRWVTYEGGGPLRSAVAGDNVTFTLTSAKGSLGIADLINPLAIHNENGNPDWPNVPYLNDVLEKEYGVTVPGIGNTFAGLVAQASFKEKHPERFEVLAQAYKAMLESAEYQAAAKEADLGHDWIGPEASKQILDEGFEVMSTFAAEGGN